MTLSRTPRVALYARVSTARDQDPQLQLDELRLIARQRSWNVVGEFVDRGISGTKDRRPQLDEMMKRVHRGGIDIVAVWRFDRFARSVRHLVLALDEFRARDINFFSARDGIDTSTPAGRFTYTVIAGVAQLEAELTRERTIAGLEVARRKGKRLGRPPVSVDLDRVKRLRAAGHSFRAVSRELGIAVGTIHRALAAKQSVSAGAPTTPQILGAS